MFQCSNSLNSLFLSYVTKYYLHDIEQYSEISMFFTNETFNRLVTSILQFYNYVNIYVHVALLIKTRSVFLAPRSSLLYGISNLFVAVKAIVTGNSIPDDLVVEVDPGKDSREQKLARRPYGGQTRPRRRILCEVSTLE